MEGRGREGREGEGRGGQDMIEIPDLDLYPSWCFSLALPVALEALEVLRS